MSPVRVHARLVCAFIALATIFARGPQATAAPGLRHLGGIQELKTWFNTGRGHPRVIFLLSPT
jgi:hypothetical protein